MCVFERNKLKGFESLLQTQKLRFSNSYTFATQPCRDTGFKNLSCDEVLQILLICFFQKHTWDYFLKLFGG